MSPELIPGNVPISTTPPARPYRVQLEGGPARPGEVVTVHDQAIVGVRCIVRSSHGEGYWHVSADSIAAADAARVLAAVFEAHPSASFTFPRR